MNAVVGGLLLRFLARSGWVYAILGLAAYITSGAFWALRFGRVPLAGTLLALWGGLAAFNARSLVWRSLPIDIADLALYRWWAAVGVPGIFLTLITLLSWSVQLSSRLPAPAAAQVLLDVLANWAALGLLAALWDEIRSSSTPSQSFSVAQIGLLLLLVTLLTIYGLPIESGSASVACLFLGAGLALALSGVLRARRAHNKRWVYAARRKLQLKFWNLSAETGAGLYGIKSFCWPVVRYATVLTGTAIVGLTIAHKVFSGIGHENLDMLLLLVALVGLSMSGSVLNYRLRTALQPLRCLPLSASRLASVLQIMGAMPGMIAALLTLLAARFLLQLNIDTWTGAGFALTLFSSFGMIGFTQQWQDRSPHRGVFVQRWMPVIQGSIVPGYLGLLFVQMVESGYWSLPLGNSTRWMWLPLCMMCLGLGHVGLVKYLRSGIRPSSEYSAFSGG